MKRSRLNQLKFDLKVAWRLRIRPTVVTVDGLRLWSDRKVVGKTVAKSLYREVHEWPERRLAARHLRPGDRTLEIGAGIGLVSLFCARICGPGNLRSYEANPRLEPIIRHNFELNGMVADLRVAAVAPEAGETTFYFDEDIYASGMVDSAVGRASTVHCDAFRDVLAEFRPNVLVMDVEGAEVDILPAGDLSGVERIILELHPKIVGQERIDGLIAHLAALGLTERESIGDSAIFAR